MAKKKTVSASTDKKPKKRGKKVLLVLLIIFAVIILAAVIAVATICITTEPIDSSLLNIKMTSSIYYEDDNGNQVIVQNLYGDENRTWASFEEMPLDMKNAFVAIEDERFYSHPGFDIKRLVGAGINTLMRLFDKNRSVYGGSTITQQLVKNLTKEDDRSVLRKFREIYRAIRLENDLSKNDILELYMNTIYLSQNCNGVGAASKIYFNKDLADLNLA
ncbi:MAG: biosynthetic peptidoglycan transglycosylase, partial [Clostridia bacterium]|nr:biosynthetic peptidoglycan transglycosylase [Clostridia bacterium]